MHSSYSQIAERHLSKSKKYYTNKIKEKDQENIIKGDIDSIIEQLTNQNTNSTIPKTKRSNQKFGLLFSGHHAASKFLQNSANFFEKDEAYVMKRKELKKQINYYISKMKKIQKGKVSLYQEYMLLVQETSDYLEYYLTNFGGKDEGTAAELLREEGKTIILLIMRKKFSCLEQNSPDIINRILLSFQLNPLNDFQFISWEKFMKMRKLIYGDFNRQDCILFIVQYFFAGFDDQITGTHFWAIFTSSIRKIGEILHASSLNLLVTRILDYGANIIPHSSTITRDSLRNIIHQDPLFIWKQFVILTFL